MMTYRRHKCDKPSCRLRVLKPLPHHVRDRRILYTSHIDMPVKLHQSTVLLDVAFCHEMLRLFPPPFAFVPTVSERYEVHVEILAARGV